MGGISVLLLIAATGITYGWQPDDSGGVEYVIQIPTDQLSQLERVGQISSVIDPEVRGHVSRVIIQVGDQPLPRITPPQLLRRESEQANWDDSGQVIAASDQSLVPIPEIEEGDQAIPIAGLAAASIDEDLNQSVMKPQTGGASAGPGFSLPSSLQNATTGPPDPNARLVIPPPATRSPPSESSFPSTAAGGQDRGRFFNNTLGNDLATVRPGGPSTEPTDTRDRTWNAYGQTSTQGTSSQGGPSTAPVTNGSQSPFDAARAANGLNPNDTFGRTPSGLPNTNLAADPQSLQYQGLSSRGNASSVNDPLANRTNAATNFGAGFSGGNQATRGLSQDNAGQYFTDANGRPITNQSQDASTLTAAQIAAGAWSVDIYGNPIDREGRIVQVNNPNNAFSLNQDQQNRLRAQSEQANQEALALQRQRELWAQQSMQANAGLQSQSGQFSTGPLSSLGQPASNNATLASNSRQFGAAGASPTFTSSPSDGLLRGDNNLISPEDRSSGSTLLPRTAPADPPSLTRNRLPAEGDDPNDLRYRASQPLVTWLLLISFVGNVYLMFWLKNLLVRYRDLVAAKRISDSGSAA